jgi:hypothetical protein
MKYYPCEELMIMKKRIVGRRGLAASLNMSSAGCLSVVEWSHLEVSLLLQ